MIYLVLVLWVLGGVLDYNLYKLEYPLSLDETSRLEHLICSAFWPASVIIRFIYLLIGKF